jgi:hypothetical protein
MTKYYSLYIRHNFVFFAQVTIKINFLGKYNIQVQYLIIFDFKKVQFFLTILDFFYFSKYGCV